MNWLDKNVEFIIGGNAPDGTRYLKLFLTEYSQLFNEKNLNPSCSSCIREYLKKYKEKMGTNENKCEYRLHQKYCGIQLEKCSSIHVNNSNITDEYAKILLKNRGEKVFAKMPTTKKTIEVEPTTDAPKQKRTRTKKR